MKYFGLFSLHIPIHNKKEVLHALFLRTLGNFLILFALFMIGKTFYTPIVEEARYFYHQSIGKKYVLAEDASLNELDKITKEKKNKGGIGQLLTQSNIEIIRPINPDFSIVIPKINANANIVANVSTTDKNGYLTALKEGVAHAYGTALPDEYGHTFLFAHSTDNFWNVSRYNAIFFLLYKLESGDEVNIFYIGKRYKYIVTGSKIVNPDEVQYLTRITDTPFLTLQTCWPLGTTWKRMLIFAEPVSQIGSQSIEL